MRHGQAKSILLITAETYSKFIHPRDRSVRTIFGDAAAATLIRAETAKTSRWDRSSMAPMAPAPAT